MDHLPLPLERSDNGIETPYMCDLINRPDWAYDRLGFKDFLARKGFHTKTYRRLDGSPLDVRETVCAYQSHCVIGLVIEFFKVFEIQITIEDLLHPHHSDPGQPRIITTSVLRSALSRMNKITTLCSINELENMFKIAFHLLVRAADISRAFESTSLNTLESEWAKVLLSGLIVGETLGDALKYYTSMSSSLPSPQWAYSNSLIEDRMHRAGWCPKVVHTIVDSMASKSLTYYLGCFKPTRRQDHTNCTSALCLQNRIDNRTYRTLHGDVSLRRNRCTVEAVDMTTWPSLVDFVSRRETPVLSVIEPPDGPVQIMVQSSRDLLNHDGDAKSSKRIRKYVCISHVWSDGLGNPTTNGLPACQMVRLQRLVNDLYPDANEPVPFWIDTLCVPLDYPARGLAIENMRETYKEADKVLVLDSLMTEVNIDTIDATEAIVRLRTSTWHRRLWTFHEAYLAQELRYQFSNRAVNLDQIFQKHREEENFIALLPDAETLDDEQIQELTSARSHKTRAYAESIFSDAYTFCRDFGMGHASKGEAEHQTLARVVQGVRWRTTSRYHDEAICISGCVGISVESINLPNLSADARLKRTFLSMKTIPASLMFVRRPHFDEEGYRWLPRTLLDGGMFSTLPGSFEDTLSTRWGNAGRPTPQGLLVDLPGILLRDVKPHGARLRNGGESSRLYMGLKDGTNDDAMYQYWTYPSGTQQPDWESLLNMDLALILCGKLDWKGTDAVLVSGQGFSRTDGVLNCKFESCMFVIGDHENHWSGTMTADGKRTGGKSLTTGIYTFSNTTWCVG